eukprot:scaffold32493_cov118-Isochrysis_galbana.AAC.3
MRLARYDHVLQHATLERIGIDGDDLVAVLELALRGDRATRLHLNDDVVERQANAKAVRLALKVHFELEHLIDRATALGGRGGLTYGTISMGCWAIEAPGAPAGAAALPPLPVYMASYWAFICRRRPSGPDAAPSPAAPGPGGLRPQSRGGGHRP